MPYVKRRHQERFLDLLMDEVPVPECARRLGVSTRTLHRYMHDPEFAERLRSVRGEVRRDWVKILVEDRKSMRDRVAEASNQALRLLEELLHSDQRGLALKAADSILDRNSETARNRHIESEVHGRYSIDPVTLRHAALVAREIDSANLKLGPAVDLDPDGTKDNIQ